MEEAIALLRSTQIKKRLGGVTALLDLLTAQSDPLTRDAEYLTALLPDVLPCLRENNFKVAMTSLEILALLLERVPDSTVRNYFKAIWNGLVECLGDSKLQVREKAVDVVVQLTQILGVATMFDRLRPCIAHKNWRTREQTVHALWRCLEQLRLFSSSVKNDVLDDVVRLLEDSAKEVRDAAMRALEKFYEHVGPSLMYDLENKKIRSGHMKTLTEKFTGSSQQRPQEPAYSATTTTSSRGSYTEPRAFDAAPMSSTARFLQSIKNKEYDFDNLSSAVEALSRPAASVVAAASSSPSQSSTASNRSQSVSIHDASLASAAAEAISAVRSGSNGISEKDVQRELSKIGDGLRLENDWSTRVESLKALQRLIQKCNHSGSSSPGLVALTQGIRSIREVLSEQVCDLRSSVAREACTTLLSLAKVLKDDFNPHAEYFMGNLMKATYVTILVISTASDASIRGIIESTKTGYNRLINKFTEGAKTRNQVLRVNCVSYLTLTLEVWNVAFLSKHLDVFLQILPPLLRDALGEVRAQARKCYWALHRLFPQEADILFDRMDASTQKNVRDDAAAREKRPIDSTSGSGTQAAASTSTSTFSSSGRFALRKDSSTRCLGDSAGADTTLLSSSTGFGNDTEAPLGSARVLSTSNASSSSSSSAAMAPSANGGLRARRVLGGAGTPMAGDATEATRSFATASRVLGGQGGGGAVRVGWSGGRSSQSNDDEQASSGNKPVSGPLRVLKPVDANSSQNQSLPPVPRAQRVQIVSEPVAVASSANGNGTESASSSSYATNGGGPVPRKDRANGPKRRALECGSSPVDDQLPPPSSSSSRQPAASEETSISTKLSSSAAGSRDQQPGGASSSSSTRPSRAAPPTSSSFSDDGFEDALSRIENGLWSVRLEAVELIDRVLEKSAPSVISTNKDKKMDERVLQALIRHLADAHYRVAQAALKALQSCLVRAVTQQQVAPFLKSLLPRLFQKFVDPKESTRQVAREILEFLVAKYDASLLVGHVVQQLTDGSNMKMKAAVCHYLKELLPGSRDYIQQSPNNAHMRGLLSKIAQLMEGDTPVTVATASGDVLQVACGLFPTEVESSMPLLAPNKRSILARALRARGIVLSLSQGTSTPQPQGGAATTPETSSNNQNLRGPLPPPPPPPSDQLPPVSRKRLAQSPSKFASSPIVTARKELPAMQDTMDTTTPRSTFDYAKLSSLSDFASLLSTSNNDKPQNEDDLDDLLAVVANNNTNESDKITAYHKIGVFIKKNESSSSFWDFHFARLLSVLLEGASDRDVNAIRVLQRMLRAQPQRGEEFFHPILIALLDSLNGRVDLAAHLAELTLIDVVRNSLQSDRVLDLLVPLVETKEPPVLQVVLHLVRTALETVVASSPSSQPLMRPCEWHARLLGALVAKLQHASSDVRKRGVDCLVAYYFANDEDTQLATYLSKHVDVTKQKLVEIFIQRKKADRHRGQPEASSSSSSLMDVTA